MLALFVAHDVNSSFRIQAARLAACLGVILGILGMAQWALARGDYWAVTGTFGQHNSLGVYLYMTLGPALGLCLSDTTRYRRLWTFALAVIWAGLLFTFSRGAWFGAAVGILFTLFQQKGTVMRWVRPSYMVLAVICVVITLFVLRLQIHRRPQRLHNLSQRQMYWEMGWKILHLHPWAGLGPGNYENNIRSYLTGTDLQLYYSDIHHKHYNDFWRNLHNLYLQLAVDNGLVGLILWMIAIGIGLWKAWPKQGEMSNFSFSLGLWLSVIAFLTHNLFDIATVNSFDLLFVIWLALCRQDSESALS
jgi:O-antigen ligase